MYKGGPSLDDGAGGGGKAVEEGAEGGDDGLGLLPSALIGGDGVGGGDCMDDEAGGGGTCKDGEGGGGGVLEEEGAAGGVLELDNEVVRGVVTVRVRAAADALDSKVEKGDCNGGGKSGLKTEEDAGA